MKLAVGLFVLGLLKPVAAWQSESLRPYHHAFPVHDLPLAKHFYGEILGLPEGRSSKKWQDYSLDGHQIVCHLVSSDYRCQDFVNPVDGDRVPVPHSGLAMTVDQFHLFANRLRDHGVQFIVEPHLRFKGQPGEQWTMFFKDPSGNNLEFKAMTNQDNLFAKYNVDEFDYAEYVFDKYDADEPNHGASDGNKEL
eukprot:g9706.t1